MVFIIIKFEDVYKESEDIKILEEQGYIITPENYLEIQSKINDNILVCPNPEYWEGKKIFITGIGGFAGSHLAEYLLNMEIENLEIYGLVRRHSLPIYNNIKHIRNKITLFEGDITSLERITEIIKQVDPHHIFHLAAESFVPTSFREPNRVMNVNVGGTINLLDACRKYGNMITIQLAGSSEEYGMVRKREIPIIEDNGFSPRSIYGISKVSMEMIGDHYHNAYGLPIITTRAFNHEGNRRGLQFFTSVIHRQLARSSMKEGVKIIIGNPNAIRDFTHVNDTVRAYILCSEKEKISEVYNICSGLGVSMGNYIKIACNILYLPFDVYIDRNRMRPSEVPLLIGDNSKIWNDIRWTPQKSIVDIIRDGYYYFLENQDLLNCEVH